MGLQTDYYSRKLSPREYEIVDAIMNEKCYSRKALAQHLFIQETTIATHLRNIYNKLSVNSMLELYIKLSKN